MKSTDTRLTRTPRAFALTALLALAVLAGGGRAHAQAALEFAPAAGSVDCGDTLFVDVTIDATVADLRGYSLVLGFDPDHMVPASVTVGDLLTGAACGPFFRWLNEGDFVDTIEVDGTLLGCSTAGPGTLLRIGFVPGPVRGQGAVSVVSGIIRDSNNVDIPYTPGTATVDNVCNTAPDAVADAYTVAEGGTLTATPLGVPAGVLDNDSDYDGDGLTATLVTGPTHAAAFALAADGGFTYTHDGTETTTDQFVYEAADGLGGTMQATATITVTPVNDAPVVTDPGPQSTPENGSVSLQIVATDAEQTVLSYVATGLPAGLSIDSGTGLITGAVACGASSGSPYAVSIDVDDLAGGITPIAFTWTVTGQVAPAAITDLAAAQVKTGNDADGTTGITVTWSGVAPTHTVAVYRKGFGFYPEYDDAGGAAPTTPVDATAALSAGWTLAALLTAPGQIDEPAVRDVYYYVAFVASECGTDSAVSNLTGGVLNYHLGDVSDTVTAGAGDNDVGSADISLLGFHYAVDDQDPLYLDYLDIGPTDDLTTDGRPLTDNVIEFEDLMMFSLNFAGVSKSAPKRAPAAANVLTLVPPAAAPIGEMVVAQLWLAGDGAIHGLSIDLDWDTDVLQLVSHAAGPLAGGQAAPVEIYHDGVDKIDVALLGAAGPGLTGSDVLATVTFEVVGTGDPAFGFGTMRVRGQTNQPVALDLEITTASPVPDLAPAVSTLLPNYPNPFNPSTTLRFGIGRSGHVRLGVYGLDGRLIRTVVDEVLAAGSYGPSWDGCDETGRQVASGVYFVRMVAPDKTESRRITLVK